MNMWTMMGLFVAGYLGLLARSAWKQGEFRQFLRSLLVVVALCGVLAGTVAVAMLLEGR